MVTLPVIVDGLSQVAARSVEISIDFVKNQALIKRDDNSPPSPPTVPAWGAAIMIVTAIFFVGAMLSYQYTIGDLIGTLSMIETPTAAVTFTASTDEPDNTLDKEQKEPLLEAAPAVMLIPAKPITSNIRATLKHLKATGGRLSRWRGIVPAVLYSFFVASFSNVLESVIPYRFAGRSIVLKTLASLAFARLHMAWTHAVISMPSELTWIQRMAPLSSYKQLWLPTVVANTAIYVSVYLMAGVAALFSLMTVSTVPSGETHSAWTIVSAVVGVICTIAFAVFVSLAVILPAYATLVRIEASMLPEDQETIVPFDRTFGGKVVPKILGGSGSIGFVDAWKTFTWESRRRLVKLYIKNAGIQVVLVLAAFHVITFELWAIMGRDIQKYASQYREWARND